jgi:fructan beta-fructosidase
MFPLLLDGDAGQAKWVVVDGSGDYVVGRFDGQRFDGQTVKLKGDWGRNFYATMTFDGVPREDGRRIQLAWMRGGAYPDMPFNQQLTFPCELTLRTLPEGPRLCRFPVREVEQLYAGGFVVSDQVLVAGEHPLGQLQGGLLDIAAEFDLSRSGCDEVAFDVGGHRVSYHVRTQQLDSCGTRAELRARASQLQLRILVDRMSVETFGNHGEVSMTNVSPVPGQGRGQGRGQGTGQGTGPAVSLRSTGGAVYVRSLAVHELNSIW